MALKYTRVKDKSTGHQYDVLSHKVDPELHQPLNDAERWPDVTHPRPAKPNVLTKPNGAAKQPTKSAAKPNRKSSRPAPARTPANPSEKDSPAAAASDPS